MRIERSVTSISWIPSDSIPGLLRVPFARGIMHYDPPPPLTLTDVDGMRRRGEFRFANRLSAYIDVDDGQITGCGYMGGKLMGPRRYSRPLRVLLPTKATATSNGRRPSRESSHICADSRVHGVSRSSPTLRWPFSSRDRSDLDDPSSPSTRTERARGAHRASPSRHCSTTTAAFSSRVCAHAQSGLARPIGSHTPWGGEDLVPTSPTPRRNWNGQWPTNMQGETRPRYDSCAPILLFRQNEQPLR